MISNVFGQANAGKTNTKGDARTVLALSDVRSKEAPRLLGAGPSE
jgi:hypothetical protein